MRFKKDNCCATILRINYDGDGFGATFDRYSHEDRPYRHYSDISEASARRLSRVMEREAKKSPNKHFEIMPWTYQGKSEITVALWEHNKD